MKAVQTSLWFVDAIKALASQLIVWHHFIAYGPMARTLRPHASGLFDWLFNDGRMAVQAFLVVGGFLTARSLAPRPGVLAFESSGGALVQLVWGRYIRLLRPYLLALLLAIVVAACARFLMQDPDTPAPASFKQLLFHVLLIHDIAGVDALSTGVWYVAIDLQLYGLLIFMLWLSQRLASVGGLGARAVSLLLIIGLAALSLLWFNRVDSLDIWCIYFFGAYSLGVIVQWRTAEHTDEKLKSPWLLILLLVYVLALFLQWRVHLVVSLLTATVLWLGLNTKFLPVPSIGKFIGWLSRISYSVFLIHYPVVLLVGTVIAWRWPESVPSAIVGYLVAWLLTLGLAHAVYCYVEKGKVPAYAALQ